MNVHTPQARRTAADGVMLSPDGKPYTVWDMLPPNMEPLPDLHPDIVNADAARQLWSSVLIAIVQDARCAVLHVAMTLKHRAAVTSESREMLLRFARRPFGQSDVSWLVTIVGHDPEAAADSILRLRDRNWDADDPAAGRGDCAAWVSQFVTPDGQTTAAFNDLPAGISKPADYSKWLDFGRPHLTAQTLPLLGKTASAAEFHDAVATLRKTVAARPRQAELEAAARTRAGII